MSKTKPFVLFVVTLCILNNYGCPVIFGYTISGEWSVTVTFSTWEVMGNENVSMEFSFLGEGTKGTVSLLTYDRIPGTWAVDGKNIDIQAAQVKEAFIFAGKISNKKKMSGTGTFTYPKRNVLTVAPFTWTARKK